MANGYFETEITTKKKLFDFNVKELFRYRDLIGLTVKRSFFVAYKQTILGPVWILAGPLFSSLIYTFVFGQLAGISTDGVPQLLFYLTGNAIWNYFAAVFNNTSKTFTDNANVFGKVYFPRMVMPVSAVISAFINFVIQLAIIAAFYLYFALIGESVAPSIYCLLLPVLFVQVGLLGLGCGIIISALTTKYRDLTIAVGFGIQLWMYVTPIVYPLSITGGIMRRIVLFNPMVMPVELFRKAILGVGDFSFGWWGLSCGMTVVLLFVGLLLFGRIEKTFMDTV